MITHKDIYVKFMLEYNKFASNENYVELTEYEVANILDKAYNALIAQKVTGNNIRRASLESDLKAIQDINPLITKNTKLALHKPTDEIATNVCYATLPEDFVYFVTAAFTYRQTDTPMDNSTTRKLPVHLVSHQMAENFFATAYNMPWIKNPVCYIEGNGDNDLIYVVYDPYDPPVVPVTTSVYLNPPEMTINYIKKPHTFVKDLTSVMARQEGETPVPYASFFDPGIAETPEKYKFELSESMAEELVSLAITFALESSDLNRLSGKLTVNKLEA